VFAFFAYSFSQAASSNIPGESFSQIKYIHLGSRSFFEDPVDNNVTGTKYLIDDFSENGIVIDKNGRKFKMQKLNIDLKSNNFVSKISKDSLFIFDNLKGIEINGKRYVKKDDDIYIVLHHGNSTPTFYKKVSKVVSKPVINPVSNLQVKAPEWRFKYIYYIFSKKANSLIPVKFNRKGILSLFEPTMRKSIKKFVSDNKLSYSKEKDVMKILYKFSNSII